MSETNVTSPASPCRRRPEPPSPVRREVEAARKTIRDWKQRHALGRASLNGRLRNRTLQADRPSDRKLKQARRFAEEVSESELRA